MSVAKKEEWQKYN